MIKADQSGEKVEQGNEVTDKKKWIALVFHIPGYLFTFYFLFNMAIQLLKYPNLPMFVLPYFPCTYFSFFFSLGSLECIRCRNDSSELYLQSIDHR